MLNQIFITAENIEQYAEYLRSEERAAATVEKYMRDIRVFSDFLNGAAVTKEAAVRWKEQLKTTREASSVNTMIAAVNGFFEFYSLDISDARLTSNLQPKK